MEGTQMKGPNPLLVLVVALLLVASACEGAAPEAAATSSPSGTVRGTIVYEDLANEGGVEPMGEVMVVLCQVPAEGLPEGPVAATGRTGQIEDICTLQTVPTGLSGSDGAFALDDVPSATYLVMFHPWPGEIQGHEDDWEGVILTQGSLDEAEMEVSPSGSLGFWERGGTVVALANWSADGGMVLARGNLCSNRLGFCLSVRDGRPHPVVEVGSNETLEVELTAHFKPDY
jgi:hypothetical protein